MNKFLAIALCALSAQTFLLKAADDVDRFNPGNRRPTTSEVALAVGDVYSAFKGNPDFEGEPRFTEFITALGNASRSALRGNIPEAEQALFDARMLATIGNYPPIDADGQSFDVSQALDAALQGQNPFVNPFADKDAPSKPATDYELTTDYDY